MPPITLAAHSPVFSPSPRFDADFWNDIHVKLDFSIIGAPKSGTSWLFSHLSRHPEIFIPGEQNAFTEFQHKGPEYYNQLYTYAKAHQRIGDYSNSYMLDPNLPQVFAERYSHIKLIMVCRHPVKRAFSHYLMDISNKRFDPDEVSFREALDRPRTYSYYDLGLYAKHIQRYLQYIPPRNFLILTLDQIRESPETTMKQVCNFLEVPWQAPVMLKKSINSWQSNRLHRSRGITLLRQIGKTMLPKRLHHRIGRNYMTVVNSLAGRFVHSSTPPTIPKDDEALLKAAYCKENRRLETIIEMDLSIWD